MDNFDPNVMILLKLRSGHVHRRQVNTVNETRLPEILSEKGGENDRHRSSLRNSLWDKIFSKIENIFTRSIEIGVKLSLL